MHLLCYQMGDTTNGVSNIQAKQTKTYSSRKRWVGHLWSTRKNLTRIVFPQENFTCSPRRFHESSVISFEVKLLRSLQLVYKLQYVASCWVPKKKTRSAWVQRFLNYEIHHHTSRILPSKHGFDRVLSGFFWGVAWMETKILQESKGPKRQERACPSVICPCLTYL